MVWNENSGPFFFICLINFYKLYHIFRNKHEIFKKIYVYTEIRQF